MMWGILRRIISLVTVPGPDVMNVSVASSWPRVIDTELAEPNAAVSQQWPRVLDVRLDDPS